MTIKDPAYYAEMTCETWNVGYSQKERTTIEFLETDLDCAVEADCSSAVNWWLYMGGYLDTCIWFHTAIERQYLKDNGFIELDCDLFPAKRNDVLWKDGHTALYIGDGKLAELIHDENNAAGWEGSQAGDQTGDESRIVYYNCSEWEYILRLPKEDRPDEKGEEMPFCFTFHIDGDNKKPMQFCDGTRVRGIKDLHELGELRHAFKQTTGKDLPHVEGLSQKFIDVMNR